MKKYKITSTQGVFLGTYEAETEAQALDEMASEAGYDDYEQVEKSVPGANRRELIIEPE